MCPVCDLHQRIASILARGEHVFSFALGRLGPIVEVAEGGRFCIVKTQRGRGATSYLAGDPVDLVEVRPGWWEVWNLPLIPMSRRAS